MDLVTEKGIASIAAGVPDALKNCLQLLFQKGQKQQELHATEMISGLMKTISAELGS